MRHFSFYLSVVALTCIVSTKSFAYDVAVENEDGVTICYSYINDGKELAVVKAESPYSYSNDVIFNIPQTVKIDGMEYPVTRIDDEAFKNSTVVMIELPDGIKSIGESAFSLCKNLISIKIPDSVEGQIGKRCFYGCGMLKSVQIGEGITKIENNSFENCSKLEKVVLPDNVAVISATSFNGCTNLASISFGKGITSIIEGYASHAWEGCSSLNKIIIRDLSAWCKADIKSIKGDVYFDEDTRIKDLVIPDDVVCIKSVFSSTGIETLTIPNSVISIEKSQTFYNCKKLRKIIFGNSLQEQGNECFRNCNNLDTIICTGTTPPALGSYGDATFRESGSIILFVPRGCISVYKNTKWGQISKDIRELSTLTLNNHLRLLRVGETDQLSATIYPSSDSGFPLLWESSNEGIVSVDENGLVKAHKPGKATITATLKSYIDVVDKCEVTVIQPVESITLDRKSVVIEEFGEMVKLIATVLPEDASDKSVRWTSSNPDVCRVTDNGTVIAVGNGTATVIATTVDGDIPATCVVNVKDYIYDVNRDGQVGIGDIVAITNYMAGKKE